MSDVLRFLGGLFGAALQWIAGVICMSPILFLLAFDESGRSAKDPPMLLIGFFLPGCFVVWFVGYLTRRLAPDLSASEPYGYGQTTIGAIFCFLGIAESIRASSMGFTTIYPMFLLFIPGLVLLLYGIRILMMVYFASE